MHSTASPRSVANRSRFAGILLALLILLALVPRANAGYPGENGDIVYQRPYKGGSEIFSVDPDGGAPQRLTSNTIKSGENIAAGLPSYSADGRKIVFINAVKRPGSGARRTNIFVMRSDGSHERRLTRSDAHQTSPRFSPDGSMIAFGQQGDVYLVDADGHGKRNVTAALPGGGYDAVFSPDGGKIALSTGDGGDSDIVVMDVDGSNPVNVTAGSDADDYSPAFSPDGTRIAFASDRTDYHGDLFVMNADGSDVQPVTSNPGVEHFGPSFSPDGTKLVYSSRVNSRGAVGVFTIGVAGGAATKLHTGGSFAESPDWGVAP